MNFIYAQNFTCAQQVNPAFKTNYKEQQPTNLKYHREYGRVKGYNVIMESTLVRKLTFRNFA